MIEGVLHSNTFTASLVDILWKNESFLQGKYHLSIINYHFLNVSHEECSIGHESESCIFV